ncbi:hypothetical protein CI109_106672 [Kwoniella shandongensis]|uniref:Uncharacterized protein n=1 Tax=Kwoniella shandongensis TaxID=1734106 RepID=A0A5M6BT69_9TREE|nr:uncharacterized protein CI109_006410 [Kwoniella shandongensis]KAA5525240.1 hypothetical protein CI109_006410 [Kwoniella shandongensis]
MTNVNTNAVASSSKRPAPSASTTTAKRPRPSTSHHEDESDGEVDIVLNADGEMDDETKAKIARKEARTIRNRESAQRSRNQRKAHLVYLETRVVELEAENRALKRGEMSTPPPQHNDVPSAPPSVGREASPAQSVMSLANDLGIPTELVSGTGVRLSNVAPPPADLHIEDIKPVIAPSPIRAVSPATSTANQDASLAELRAENAGLRERVSLLENLVKQVVAVANLSGLDDKPTITTTTATAIESSTPTTAQNAVDWAAFLSAPSAAPAPGLESTLSPSLFPSTILNNTDSSATSAYQSSFVSESKPTLSEVTSNPVARHPAAVATESSVFLATERRDEALQRARGITSMSSLARALGSTQGMDAVFYQGGDGQQGMFTNENENKENVVQMEWNQQHSGGQVQIDQVESWDEAMRTLIEDLEGSATGAEQMQVENGNGLRMDWYGVDGGSVVV